MMSIEKSPHRNCRGVLLPETDWSFAQSNSQMVVPMGPTVQPEEVIARGKRNRDMRTV
jgi:hypothetical protein